MDYEKLEKYISYVLSQVGEGNHNKNDIIQDLQKRGLSEEEIEYVVESAWCEGKKIEDSTKKVSILSLLLYLISPLLIISVFVFTGRDVITTHSLHLIIAGLIAIFFVIFKKRRFK